MNESSAPRKITDISPGSPVREARRTPRRPYRRPVGVLVAGRYEVLEGRGLSEDGALLALGDADPLEAPPRFTKQELGVGARVAVSLILPSGSTLVLRGEVVHHEGDTSTGHLVEIRFGLVPLHQRREIRKCVSSTQAGEADLN